MEKDGLIGIVVDGFYIGVDTKSLDGVDYRRNSDYLFSFYLGQVCVSPMSIFSLIPFSFFYELEKFVPTVGENLNIIYQVIVKFH